MKKANSDTGYFLEVRELAGYLLLTDVVYPRKGAGEDEFFDEVVRTYLPALAPLSVAKRTLDAPFIADPKKPSHHFTFDFLAEEGGVRLGHRSTFRMGGEG